jgi:hypothetical protein
MSRRPSLSPNAKMGLIAGAIVGGLFLMCGGAGVVYLVAKRGGAGLSASGGDTEIKPGGFAKVGTLTVNVQSVHVTSARATSPGGTPHFSIEPLLVIQLKITHSDGTRNGAVRGASSSAYATDEHGNRYGRHYVKAESGFTCDIDDQLGDGSYEVRSDRPLFDTLVLSRPVPSATRLKLVLDAENYGGSGKLIFDLPLPKPRR